MMLDLPARLFEFSMGSRASVNMDSSLSSVRVAFKLTDVLHWKVVP